MTVLQQARTRSKKKVVCHQCKVPVHILQQHCCISVDFVNKLFVHFQLILHALSLSLFASYDTMCV